MKILKVVQPAWKTGPFWWLFQRKRRAACMTVAEAMRWCDDHTIGYIFGFLSNCVLWRKVTEKAKARCYNVLDRKAASWSAPRRVIAKIEALRPDAKATRQASDVCYVMTSLEGDA